MIYLIIALLAIILVALLVDWQKILSRTGKAGRLTLPGKKNKFSESANASRKDDFVQATEFNFEMTDQEHQTVDKIVVEEQESEGYRSTREVEHLLAEADVCFRKGEMKAAENFYLQAAVKDPRCSKAYSRLGVIYLENGENWEDAEEAFRQALKTDPTNGFVLNNLGLVLYHQDKYADAIRHFEQAVRQDELNAARHANLGMGYMAMRQYAKAESSFKKALKLSPNQMEYKDLLNESIEKKKAHKTMIRR
jgi:Tfp pilus assembly protein PilF